MCGAEAAVVADAARKCGRHRFGRRQRVIIIIIIFHIKANGDEDE